MYSSALPFWFPLFEERRDPLAKIGAFTDAGIFADGGFNLRIEFRARMLGKQPLGLEKRERTVLRQLRRKFPGPVEQFFGRDDFVNQAYLQGFRRVEDAARKQQVAGNLFSDLAQEKSRDDRGDESDANLGVTKLRVGHGEREIAKQGKAGAAGDGRAIYGGNCWFGKF